MRCMNRNKRHFWYSTYTESKPMTDEDGFLTGEYQKVYGHPEKAKANISAAVGQTETQQFGDPASYDKVIVMDLPAVLNEYSILWIDTEPVINDDGTTDTPNDYIVKKVAQSLNSVSYAVKKVDVNE